MNTKTYNINELLEYKKELEADIGQKNSEITNESLKYEEFNTTDHKNSKRNKTYTPRKKVSLTDYYQELFGLIDELARVKIAIQKYNAEQVVDELHKRTALRMKHEVLTNIRSNLPKKKHRQSSVTRENTETGEALESEEHIVEPMFPIKDVEDQLRQTASEERKTNTQIQKTNLSAKITL